MKFNLLDKIESITDEQVIASKFVTMAEEYLADHFPRFPVLPGVLMLETLVQAATWLAHRRRSFACSMAQLREAKNVRYGQFVMPGHSLRVDVKLEDEQGAVLSFKASGTVDGSLAVAARIELSYFNLADQRPEMADVDERLRQHHRRRFAVLQATDGPAIAL